ncbi:unnamed protein product [Brassica oleracea var. botrytis]|uniref:(rape) hypothetical protein n=1 Tax=Brassica napus TaxID=3708 RepID=A0A816KFQ5_BRANA|nr:unnamed protein product [Brassica napus]
MLMYRFAMEVDKARNSLDLNVRAETDTGDHIVTTVANHLVLKHTIPDGTQLNEMGGFGRKIPQYQVPLDVSSTASSTEHQTGVLGSGQINNSTLGRGYIHGEHISEKGETSRRVIDEDDIKVEPKETTDKTIEVAQRIGDDVVDGNRGGKEGGQ